eukprot:gene60986-81312_t
MSIERFVSEELRTLYDVHEWRNGLAVLSAALPDEWNDIQKVLSSFRLYHSEIATPGGSKSLIANRIDKGFAELGWT